MSVAMMDQRSGINALATSRRTLHWREEVICLFPENVVLYDDAYRTFSQLYPALKEALRWKGERVNGP